MTPGRLAALVPVALLAAGAVSSGQGMWIYAKARLAQLLLERAWSATATRGVGEAPWPWADTWPVARLTAPSLGVDLIVLAGGSGRTIAFGPGHLDATADPGRPGNCVLVGHRDTHFAFVERLQKGDGLVVERPDGGRVRYRVVDCRVVDRGATWVVEPTGGTRLTLVTCYPFRSPTPGGRSRYVVRAVAAPPTSDRQASKATPAGDPCAARDERGGRR